MQLTNGTLLQGGKYKIESVLGQGAYGITYLATATMKGALGNIAVKVAIKEFFSKELNTRKVDGNVSEVSSDSLAGKYSNMFLREARNLSHLKHEGIVNVLEAFSENNTHYYVMEYVDGGSLDAYIRSKGRLSERETLSLARQIGSALSFMHENKMLHLDLKPKNIMLRADGTLCLIDFGLSKQYEADGEPESSTTIGLGTPGYAPLEQGDSDDRKTFAPTLDIYAFGATLFKMLTGKTPPRSSDIFNEGFPEDELLSLGISEATLAAIKQAMSPRMMDRPQSVEALLTLLDISVGDVVDEDTPGEDSEDTEHESDVTPYEKEPAGHSDGGSEEHSSGNNNSKITTVAKNIFRLFRTKKFMYVLASCVSLAVAIALFAPFKPAPDGYCEATYSDGVLKVNGIEYPMVYVEEGSFMRNVKLPGDSLSREQQVTLSSYYIGKYEVTQDLWEAVMGNNPSWFKGSRKPVEHVSWYDCQEFIQKLSSFTGQHFTLPTQTQWEFAARGGNNSKGYKYSGSDNIDEVAWYSGNSRFWWWPRFMDYFTDFRLHDVGDKLPNELGIYDMSGNVYEWCFDGYAYYPIDPETDPWYMGGYGVICGGCSVVDPSDCLTSAKDNQPRDERWKLWQSQDNGISGFGLRLCLPLNLPDCEASYSNGILKVNGIEYPMVYVSGGSFMMGSDDSEALFDEKPVHRVTLSSYRIGKYEVTQDLWEAVMGSNPSCFKGSRKPVERVSWYDCLTFIRKLNSLTGQNFKLPTEAQWEFAARGGNSSNGYKYSGSNYIDNVGWYGDNSGNTTHNVGTKSPNELGIYDMSGNVWEWCCDWYGGYSSSSQTNPEGLSLGYRRICRGGSWLSCHQVYNRYHLPPDQWGRVYGLRLCL